MTEKNKLKGLCGSLLLWLFCWLSFAQQSGVDQHLLILNADTEKLDLRGQVGMLRADRGLQLSDVQANEGWSLDADNRPLSDGQSLWIKIPVDYQHHQAEQFSFVIGNPTLDYLDVFVLDDMGRILRSYLMGAARNSISLAQPYPHFALPLEMSAGQSMQIYLRVIDDGPMVFPLEIWRTKALQTESQWKMTFTGIVAGALGMLFTYFLITYVLLRSPIRFWFAVATLSLLLLFLNIQGLLSALLGLGSFISHATTVLIALVIFAAAKVAHAMLVQVPAYWRFVAYSIAGALLLCALTLNAYWQIVSSSALAGAAVFLQLLLALLFRNSSNSLPNRVYALGWVLISVSALVEVGLFLSGVLLAGYLELLLTLSIISGLVLIAVAVEAHGQREVADHQQRQNSAIKDLHLYYEVFKESANGQYISTIDGKLLSTNPAMSKIFGFEDEQQMQAQIQDASALYADPADRELLLGHIYQQGLVLDKEVKGVRRDGSEFWFSISGRVHEYDGQKLLFGALLDATEKKQSSINMEYLAGHDTLTGMHNRRAFEVRLADAISGSQQSAMTLLQIDLEQFKAINDSCGHQAGDLLIRQLASIFSEVVVGHGMISRFGGDQFNVLLEADEAQFAYLLANRISNRVQAFRFNWENRIFTLSCAIGVVSWQAEITSAEQWLSMVDTACQIAKRQGNNRIHSYTQEDEQLLRHTPEVSWPAEIDRALQENRFCLYYQHYHPLSHVADGHYYELLLRMRSDSGNLIMPDTFLLTAQSHNLTATIDRWVIANYFTWLSARSEHLSALKLCNINLNGYSLTDKQLKPFILNAFEKYRIPHEKICFEISETLVSSRFEETLAFIDTFSRLGCKFALDDFGNASSSYRFLKKLPVDLVKINGNFVKDLLLDPIDLAMVGSIKDVADALEMKTIAESVESKDIMTQLGKMGIDFAQGYAIADPRPLEAFCHADEQEQSEQPLQNG